MTIFLLFFLLSANASAKKIVIINENIDFPRAKQYTHSSIQPSSNILQISNEENTNQVLNETTSQNTGNTTIILNDSFSSTNSKENLFQYSNFSTNQFSNITIKTQINDESLLSTNRSPDACKDLIYETLGSFPKNHFAGLKTIELLYDKTAKRGGANGNYLRIRCNDISDTELKSVVVHELGHIVDGSFLVGNSTQNSNFIDFSIPVKQDDPSVVFYSYSWISEKQKKSGSTKNDFCSLYGQSNPFEDFAECYNLYALNSVHFESLAQKSDILKKKFDFMKNQVFGSIKIVESPVINEKQQIFDNTKLKHFL